MGYRKVIFSAILLLMKDTASAVTAEQYGQRVHSHIVIKDYQGACNEALAGLNAYPQSKILWQAYIRALAKSGNEKDLMVAWHQFLERFPEERDNREILECLAWGVIDKGIDSSSPLIRVTAILGGFFSQDIKGIAILQKGLQDNHSGIREAAIKLSSLLHDNVLQEEILRLLRQEKVWDVRLEAIEAIGELRMREARDELLRIVSQDNTHEEEKTSAIAALVLISDSADRAYLTHLVQSNRLGMRLLACEMIAYYEQIDDIDLLFPLIKDHHATVRAKAFETFGRLRVSHITGQPVEELAAVSVNDPDPLVAVTAAWVLTLANQQRGQVAFAYLLQHPNRPARHLAAAGLASAGKYGLPLTVKAFRESSDPYIKMNLAVGLIGQRMQTEKACDCLYAGLAEQKERWAWQEEGNFRILAPSKEKHDEAIPNYPEAVNQITRLEVLQLLAIVHYPKAQHAIKKFLQESNWGITGMAAALLLTEGDEDAIELVKGLLNDPDQKVKIQAALILALWGSGEDAVNLLQQSYADADRELKGQILEGIGRVGLPTSLFFLAERLQEPYQTLRIAAAAALLDCLYH